VARGLDPDLARKVAQQQTGKDALSAHLRDELGISETVTAHPVQAAVVSALTFSVGAALPLAVAALVAQSAMLVSISAATLAALVLLGTLGAAAGGASRLRGALRVVLWGAMAMAATAGVGYLFDVVAA
jgi:vacuolar iron transporter family protein